MAKIPKAGLHNYSLANDPKEPHTIVWQDASAAEVQEYHASRTLVAANRTNDSLTPDQAVEREIAVWSFVFGRIVGVKNWVVDQEDGTERKLEWPADREAILKSFSELPSGLRQLFKDEVITATFPNDLKSYGIAAKVKLYPNS